MRLSQTVEARDAAEALLPARAAITGGAGTPRRGIDMDKILTGHSASDRRQRSAVADGIAEILAEMPAGRARLAELCVKLKERNGAFDMSVQEATTPPCCSWSRSGHRQGGSRDRAVDEMRREREGVRSPLAAAVLS